MKKTLRLLMNVTPSEMGSSALDEWLARVADVPIEEMPAEDLCRAVRQGLCLEDLVPCAIERVKQDANAGAVYDGELASVLCRVTESFWKAHGAALENACNVFTVVSAEIDEKVRDELASFQRMADRIQAR